MKTRALIGTTLATGLALTVGQMNAIAVPGDGGEGLPPTGADVIVGELPDIAQQGIGTFQNVQYAAYSFGTVSCNLGSEQLVWNPNTVQHPVIPQNLYRVRNGAIEQIGMSWLKHGFCALQQTACGTCTPAASGCPQVLGIGCSDPYSAGLNGSNLRARGPVNASTGEFAVNYSSPASLLPSPLATRVAVARNDLDPALNAGAQYFVEAQYVHIDDAAANNDNNNASYRKVSVGSNWSTGTGYPLSYTAAETTRRGLPAIFAWKAVHPDVTVNAVDVAGDGRFLVGSRATNNGNGTWRYEYAVQNLNSHRSGGSFSVPVPAGVTITNVGFSAPKYLNGEGYTNAAWTATQSNGQLTWSCEPNSNANANALRWATLYNFRFDASVAPVTASAALGLWRAPTAGSPATSANVSVSGPGIGPPPCPLVDSNCDGSVNGVDLGVLLAQWGTSGTGTGRMDLNADNYVDGLDLGILLSNWGAMN